MKKPMSHWSRLLFAGAIAVPLLLLAWGYWNQERQRELVARNCPSNLRQIGLACILYAHTAESQGRFPDTMADVFLNSDLAAKQFVCLAAKHQPAEGTSRRAIADAIASSAAPPAENCRCSYVYVGRGLTKDSPSAAVVAYEPASNHHGQGGNLVRADGTVFWHNAKSLAKIVAAIEAGQNPPPK